MQQPTPCHVFDTEKNEWWLPADREFHKKDCEHFQEEKPSGPDPVDTTPDTTVPAVDTTVDPGPNSDMPLVDENGNWEAAYEAIAGDMDPTKKLVIAKFIVELLEMQQQQIANRIIANLFKEGN